MTGGGSGLATRALLLQRVPLGDADLVLTLFTEARGRVSALARNARRSQRRFGGALEPFHELAVRVTERPGHELGRLEEATLGAVRARLVQRLDAMEAAGVALGWVRSTVAPGQPDPPLWAWLTRTLEALDAAEPQPPRVTLAEAGLTLLGVLGWALELEQCVRCGKRCAPDRAAMLDGARGGLVCRACGGGPLRASAAQRARLLGATRGATDHLRPEDAPIALALVAGALAAGTR